MFSFRGQGAAAATQDTSPSDAIKTCSCASKLSTIPKARSVGPAKAAYRSGPQASAALNMLLEGLQHRSILEAFAIFLLLTCVILNIALASGNRRISMKVH